MIRKVIIFILFNSFLISNNSSIDNLVIGFWPEYDHPGVLVSIQVLSDSTDYPYIFNLNVPKNSKMAIANNINGKNKITEHIDVIKNNEEYLLPLVVNSSKFYAQFYFNPAEYVDLSNAANLKKFYNGGPVDFGSDGSTPTGTSPIMFVNRTATGAVTDFDTNAGTGGSIGSKTGTLTASSNIPSTGVVA